MSRILSTLFMAGGALLLPYPLLAQVSNCGAHPPGIPPVRHLEPYALEPDDLRPFSKFTAPYYQHYVDTNIYQGAARDVPDPDLKTLKEIRIGFFGPIGTNPDHVAGTRMLHGAQLAIDDANTKGGYCGKPFQLMLHNDYDNWQAGQVYGNDRPTDPAIWGSASNIVPLMVYDEGDWAIFGSISSESTHIILRVALRAEVPIINSASTDPTIPETLIPWYFTDIQDDRVQSLTLARHIYNEVGLKRMAILRLNNRYGRFGVGKFRDASRRLSHPVVIEQKFLPGDTDFRHQLRIIQESRVDGILIWGDQDNTANILKQMHELGMKQRVFGSHRTVGEDLIRLAGADAEGFEAVYPYDPLQQHPKWMEFSRHYEARFQEKPEHFAALAYDAMQVLIQSIRQAGLNRARIHDALSQVYTYKGVTGDMLFDTNSKNISPLYLVSIHDGKMSSRQMTMEKVLPQESQPSTSNSSSGTKTSPYARVGEDGVVYAGPPTADLKAKAIPIAVIGAKASKAISSPEVLNLLTQAAAEGRALQLLPVDSEASWGQASTEMVKALSQQQAIAILALDRNAAHLAEQFALKFFVPVLALSSDRSLTSINIPWIFRQQPETSVAQALGTLAEAIHRAGPNAGRIRALLASGETVAGQRFQSTGEPF